MIPDVASPYTIAQWLDELGLPQYTERFEAAAVDFEVLPYLTDDDLKELGVTTLGHRRKILARLWQMSEGGTADTTPGERRYLTVMFCDLVGSTHLAERLGPERFSELLGRYYRATEKVAEAYAGHVAQYHGDGVMVYFGYPNAIENAASHGVLAALKTIAAVAEIDVREDLDEPLAIRVGVASGLVVIASHQPGWKVSSGRAFGATVNLAARLQTEARPGHVVVSETSADLVRGAFHLKALGEREVKGLEAPCKIFEIVGQRSGELGDGPLSAPSRTQFVNRYNELAVLDEAWQSTCQGLGGLVTVTGEAGIGKSRLVSEFLARLKTAGVRVSRFSCQPHSQDVPFHPFQDALKERAGDGQVRALLRLLNDTTAAKLADRRQRRSQIIKALTDYLAQARDQGPRVVWFEDLHWADPSTTEALAQLLRDLPQKLLVVACARNEQALAGIGKPARAWTAELNALSLDHTRSIIRATMSGIPGAEDLIESLAQRADGMPIFAEELATEFRDRMASQAADEATPRSGSMPAIPSSLQQSIQARIGRLSSGRTLLRIAASIGRTSPMPILRELFPRPGHFDGALNELVESGFARLRAGRDAEQDNQLVIRHQMVLECVYDMILMRDRVSIHDAIANALAARAERGSTVEPHVMASHLERAERFREAAEYWAKAGQIAAAQSADAEAVTLYRRALAQLPRVDDKDWSEQFEADTLLAMFPAQIGAEGYRAASSDVMRRVDDLVARRGGAQRFFSSMFFHWIDLLTQGDIDVAHDFAVSLAGIAAADASGLQQMMLNRMNGSTHMFRGEFSKARRELQSFLDSYNPEAHAAPLRQFGATDNYVTVLCCLSAMESIDGSAEATREAIGRAVAAAEACEHVHTLCHTLTFGAALPAAILGDWEALRRYASQLTNVAQVRGLGFWLHFSCILNGILQLVDGSGESGYATFQEGARGLRRLGFQFMMPTFHLLFAAAALGRPETVRFTPDLAWLEEELAQGERWLLAECKRLRQTGPEHFRT